MLVDFGYLVMPDKLLSLGPLAAVNVVDGLAASLVLIAIIALGVIAGASDAVQDIIVPGLLGATILAFLPFNLRLHG